MKTKKLLPFFGAAILTLIIFYFSNLFFNVNLYLSLNEKLIALLIFLLGIYINAFFYILIHELFHLVFGLLNGFKFYNLTCWFLSFSRKRHGLKINFCAPKIKGSCTMLPVSEKKLYKNMCFLFLAE